jgi:hypothetical protein
MKSRLSVLLSRRRSDLSLEYFLCFPAASGILGNSFMRQNKGIPMSGYAFIRLTTRKNLRPLKMLASQKLYLNSLS